MAGRGTPLTDVDLSSAETTLRTANESVRERPILTGRECGSGPYESNVHEVEALAGIAVTTTTPAKNAS
jgi:hypothetical protein